MTRVWDESPYSRDLLLAHLAMADFANDEGHFWAKQETIAKKARCSPRYIKMIVQRMQEDGFLRVVKKGRRNTYYLTWPSTKGELSSPVIGESHDIDRGTPVPPHREPSVEPSVEPFPKTSSSGATPVQEDSMKTIGDGQSMPEWGDRDPKSKDVKHGTQAWLLARFREEAKEVGVQKFSIRHFNRLCTDLRENDGLANEEIEIVIRVFFTRHRERIRKAVPEYDLVRVFHAQLNSGLLNQADDLIQKHRRGDTSDVTAPSDFIRERYFQ